MNLPLLTTQSAASTPSPVSTAEAQKAKLKSVCQDFESVFFDMMLKEMRKTVPADPLLGDDQHQQEIFQGMMDDAVSKQMAAQGGSQSLVDTMYRQLTGNQLEGIETGSAGKSVK